MGRLIEKEGISLEEEDATDLSAIFNEVGPTVNKSYPPDSPQRNLLGSTVEVQQPEKQGQMRWHPLVVRFALNLKYVPTSAYRAIRQGGIINLPSERTLSDYTHLTSAHSGVQIEFIEHFKYMLQGLVSSPELRLCALSMDEMKINSALVFSKRSGSLGGFVDLGSANRDMERLVDDDTVYSTNGRLVDRMLVFMARAVFKPTLVVAVAHYPSLNLSGKYAKPFCY